MSFASLHFLLFITVFTALFLALARTRVFLPFLLIASYVFYGWWDYRFCALLALSTLVDYHCGWRVANAPTESRARAWLLLSLAVNLGVLFVFKYFGFFVDSARVALNSVGIEVGMTALSIVLPVGISFFTFQNLSYTLDIHAGRLRPERSLVRYATFVAFFPQLVAGPVVRARDLLPQIMNRPPEVAFAVRLGGLEKVVWGFFLKLGLADNAAAVVDARFANPEFYNAAGHAIGLLCFSVQIYGDFAGYSLIAIGLAQIYGYTLCENFRRPYFARGFGDFWRRWHVSLSSWFRDYVYMPLGGSRTWRLRVRNVVLTMLVSGLWHGAAWTFVLWGALHAAFLLGEDAVRRVGAGVARRPPAALAAVCRAGTAMLVFGLVTLAWLPFRADGMATVGTILGILAEGDFSMPHGMQQASALVRVLLLGAVVLAVDAAAEWGGGRRLVGTPLVLRAFACSWLVVLLLLFGSFQNRGFIYFQF